MKILEIIESQVGKHKQDGYKSVSIKLPKEMLIHIIKELEDYGATVSTSIEKPTIFGMEIIIDNSLSAHEFRIQNKRVWNEPRHNN